MIAALAAALLALAPVAGDGPALPRAAGAGVRGTEQLDPEPVTTARRPDPRDDDEDLLKHLDLLQNLDLAKHLELFEE